MSGGASESLGRLFGAKITLISHTGGQVGRVEGGNECALSRSSYIWRAVCSCLKLVFVTTGQMCTVCRATDTFLFFPFFFFAHILQNYLHFNSAIFTYRCWCARGRCLSGRSAVLRDRQRAFTAAAQGVFTESDFNAA